MIADRGDVIRALEAAQAPLRDGIARADRSHVALFTYAAMKIGVPKDDPAIRSGVDRVAAACKDNTYDISGLGNHAVYVAGIDAMLLADYGGSRYRTEVATIRDFLIDRQNDQGSWAYTRDNRTNDMSVTQYALLGLWAAERVGATVEKSVWARSARFLLNADVGGGYAYRAGGNERPTLNMTGAGLTGLAICRRYLAGGFASSSGTGRRRNEAAAGVLYGILRPVEIEEPEEEPEPEVSRPIDPNLRVSRAELDDAIDATADWIDRNFAVTGDTPQHLAYWFYTLERAGALSGREFFAETDWYNACVDALLPQQSERGTWFFANYDINTDTSFVALFLARPTRKLAGRKVTPTIGGGLLAGGRGLPSDLSSFGKAEDGEKKSQTPLEKLLAELSTADETALPQLQDQVVRQIQIADPRDLVGQHKQLLELVGHRDSEIRRTALWAIGRTGSLSLARYAIAALDDRDPLVLTEARNALAWIARRPDGFGISEDPLERVESGASTDEKVAAVDGWRREMIKTWGQWYLENAPYDDRFDEFDLDLRRRLAEQQR